MSKKIFRELSAPVNLQWEVTPGCNYCCIHCYNYWREKETGVPVKIIEPSSELLEKTTIEIIKNSIIEVIITGGEPLLVIDKIIPYLYRLKKAGIRLLLNTNASLITPTIMGKLIETGITSLLVSLPSSNTIINDEITQSKNSAQRTIKGIKIAIACGITPMVNMVVSQKNFTEIYNTAKFLKSIGVDHIGISKAAVPHNRAEFKKQALKDDLVKKMLIQITKVRSELGIEVDSLIPLPQCFSNDPIIYQAHDTFRSCMAGKTTCVIGYDGEIRACLHIPKSYGSIRDGLKTAWKNMSDWRTDKWIPKKCQKCSKREVCGGGCKAEVLGYGGDMYEPDPFANFKNPIFETLPEESSPKINENDVYVTSNHLYGRKEKFGGIFAVGGRAFPMNKELFRFLANSFNNHNSFGLSGICHILGVSSTQGKDTISYLLESKIINICQK